MRAGGTWLCAPCLPVPLAAPGSRCQPLAAGRRRRVMPPRVPLLAVARNLLTASTRFMPPKATLVASAATQAAGTVQQLQAGRAVRVGHLLGATHLAALRDGVITQLNEAYQCRPCWRRT